MVGRHLICEVLDEGVVDLSLGGRRACLEQPHGEAHDAENTENDVVRKAHEIKKGCHPSLQVVVGKSVWTNPAKWHMNGTQTRLCLLGGLVEVV